MEFFSIFHDSLILLLMLVSKIVGADVEGLYPALKDIEVAEICYRAIMNSSIAFNNINFVRASIVAMNMTSDETSTIHLEEYCQEEDMQLAVGLG